ncbi:MAG: Mur ligase family protein [Candidatus Binataceae bacterium]|jgi:UDP-N-acetylmuramate: L-alanyl-gamma-D-glutamyl-meso-diaminopimelate ligase
MLAAPAAESAARIARIPAQVNHVHLVGIAGSAMAALAGMLAARGFRVTGSDSQLYEPAASQLARLNLQVAKSYSPANLRPAPGLAVIGNVITRANPEAQALIASPIPYVSMPEALRHFFLRERRVLMVAGTHGKTTSTALMAHVLETAGRDPSMLVGGVALDHGSNYRLGSGLDFVIEGDEYDTAFFDKGPKFLHYGASGTIITAVEFDHADIYRDLDHVKASFRALAAQMDSSTVMVVSADFPHALDATGNTRARRLTFGLTGGKFRAGDITIVAAGARFAIEHRTSRVARELRLPIGGRMNVANALGVWVLLKEFGLSDDELARGLESFPGVKRRQEIVGEAAGVTVIDDFAHHPTAIRVTLEAIAERYAGRRIIAAFEPRSNSARRAVFQDDFASAFDRAARVYLAPVYFKENDPIPAEQRLDVGQLMRAIRERGPVAIEGESTTAMAQQIADAARAGDVIVCMSNGPFDRLPLRIVEALRSRD